MTREYLVNRAKQLKAAYEDPKARDAYVNGNREFPMVTEHMRCYPVRPKPRILPSEYMFSALHLVQQVLRDMTEFHEIQRLSIPVIRTLRNDEYETRLVAAWEIGFLTYDKAIQNRYSTQGIEPIYFGRYIIKRRGWKDPIYGRRIYHKPNARAGNSKLELYPIDPNIYHGRLPRFYSTPVRVKPKMNDSQYARNINFADYCIEIFLTQYAYKCAMGNVIYNNMSSYPPIFQIDCAGQFELELKYLTYLFTAELSYLMNHRITSNDAGLREYMKFITSNALELYELDAFSGWLEAKSKDYPALKHVKTLIKNQ